MPFLPAPRRHSRWAVLSVFWLLAALAVGMLLLPFGWEARATALSLLGVWLLAAMWLWLAAKRTFAEDFSLGLPLLALVAGLALATLHSSDPAVSINGFTTELGNVLVLLLAYATARNTRGVRQALAWLAGVAVLLALYGIYQHAVGLEATLAQTFPGRTAPDFIEQEVIRRLHSRRAFSLFAYPNLFSGFLALMLPLALGLCLTAAARWRRGIWAGAAGIFALALYASGSFAGWLAAAVGVGIMLGLCFGGTTPALPSNRRTMVWLLLGAIAVAGALAIVWQRQPQALWSNLQSRLVNWESAGRMAFSHGLTGVGPGLFGDRFPEFQSRPGYFVRYAHNFLLHRLAETGWIGLLTLLWFLGAAAQKVAQAFSGRMSGQRRILTAGLAAAVSAGFIHACLDVDMHFLKNALMFWFLLGSLLGLAAGAEPAPEEAQPELFPEVEPEPRLSNPWLVKYGLGALLLVVLWRGGRSLPVEIVLYSAAGLLAAFFLIANLSPVFGQHTWLHRLPLRWPLGLLFIWGIASALLSPNPEAAISGLVLGACGLLLYGLAANLKDCGALLLRVLVWAGVGLSAAALFQALAHPGMRADAGWPNANLLAAFLAMSVLAATALAQAGGSSPFRRGGWLAGMLFCFFGLLATRSLGGVLNLAAGLTMLAPWLWQRSRRRIFALAFPAAMLLMALLLPLLPGQRLAPLVQYRGPAYERLHLAQAALHMGWDRALTGWGPGNFKEVFDRYSFPNIRGLARYGKYTPFAHNELLQIWAVMGLPGLALLLWLLWSVVRGWRRQSETAQQIRELEPARAAAWACLAGAAAQGLVDFNWHTPALLAWSLCLLAVAMTPPVPLETAALAPEPPADFSFPRWSRQVAAVVLILLALVAATSASRPLLAQYYERAGQQEREKKNLVQAITEFRRALLIHPLSARSYDLLGQAQADLYAAVPTEYWFALSERAERTALALDDNSASIHRHLAQLYALKAAQLSGEGRLQKLRLAIQQYRLALLKAPQHAVFYFELGNLQRDMGDTVEAEKSWLQAVALEPNYAAAWSNLGVAQEIRGDSTAAESSYRSALRLRALIPAVQGKFEMELLSLNWAVVHFNLAHLLERQGRWREARDEYGQVLRLEPADLQARRRYQELKKLAPAR